MSHCRVDVLPPFLVDFSMGSVQRKVGKAYPSPKGPNHLAFDMVVGVTCEVGNDPRHLLCQDPPEMIHLRVVGFQDLTKLRIHF